MKDKLQKESEKVIPQDTSGEVINIKEPIENLTQDETKNNEAEHFERLARLHAEFDNFRKRTEKEKQEIKLTSTSILIAELLPVLDNFELSLSHNEDKGVRMIFDELKKVLENQGLAKIDTSKKFNPSFHEALMQEDGDEEGIILEEFQKGYTLNNKLLRASKVKVSKLKEN